MKKLTDEEIQSRLDAGEPLPEGDADVASYRALFKTLDEPVKGSLPYGFASKVVRALRLRQQRAADRRLFIAVLVLILLGFAGAFVALAMMSKQGANDLAGLFGTKGILLTVVLLVIALPFSGLWGGKAKRAPGS